MAERIRHEAWRVALWWAFGIALVLVASVAVFAAYLMLPVSTPPFRDAGGNVLPDSIASIERWKLNGISQSVLLRGRRVSNPILIWVHGGPGTSETPLFRHYNGILEEHFLVVYWDQRYAGQSLDPFGERPAHEDTGEYVSDLSALVERICARFHRNKVVIVAHSWGTVPGILYVEGHPGRVAAYVGIGQVADTLASEKLSFAFVLNAARARGNTADVSRLLRLGPPPRRGGDNFTPRDLLIRYGGSFHADIGLGTLALVTLGSSEANWRDFAAFAMIADFNTLAMKDLSGAVLDEQHTHFGVPICFVSGRYDHQVEASLAYRYFQKVTAPEKNFVWFEHSAHGPPFEEPDKFNAWMTRTILPLAAQNFH